MKYVGTVLVLSSVATGCGSGTEKSGSVPETETTTPAPLPDEARAIAFQWAALPTTDLDSPVIQATRAAVESRWFTPEVAADIYKGAEHSLEGLQSGGAGTVKFRVVDVSESDTNRFLVSVCTNSTELFTSNADGQWQQSRRTPHLDVYTVEPPVDPPNDPLRSAPELAQDGTDPSAIRLRYPSWEVFNGYEVSLTDEAQAEGADCAEQSSEPHSAPQTGPPVAGNWFPGWLRPTEE